MRGNFLKQRVIESSSDAPVLMGRENIDVYPELPGMISPLPEVRTPDDFTCLFSDKPPRVYVALVTAVPLAKLFRRPWGTGPGGIENYCVGRVVFFFVKRSNVGHVATL